MAIWTKETHPDHDVIGRRFRAFGREYICDSYDTHAGGFWMTPATLGQSYPFDDAQKDRRRNVSERAIGRTYHLIPVWG